jgi:hypothetical protein
VITPVLMLRVFLADSLAKISSTLVEMITVDNVWSAVWLQG